jgi:hypothetical protein
MASSISSDLKSGALICHDRPLRPAQRFADLLNVTDMQVDDVREGVYNYQNDGLGVQSPIDRAFGFGRPSFRIGSPAKGVAHI